MGARELPHLELKTFFSILDHIKIQTEECHTEFYVPVLSSVKIHTQSASS